MINENVEVPIEVHAAVGPDGRRLGNFKCPECGVPQPISVDAKIGEMADTGEFEKKKYTLETKNIQILTPWACEHMKEFMECRWEELAKKTSGGIEPRNCDMCGQPKAHNLTTHGMLCHQCEQLAEKVCDFCTTPNAPWVYPTRDFLMIQPLGTRSTKGWAACDDCKVLIDADDKKTLSRRATAAYLKRERRDGQVRTDEIVRMVTKTIKQMHARFHANRYGPAIPMEDADKIVPPPPKRLPEGTAQYMGAIEKRLEWSKWAELHGQMAWLDYGLEKLELFKYTLDHGDTYYMDQHFCELVDGARQAVPGDLEFHRDWMVSPYGWIWLAKPFTVPDIEDQKSLEDNKNPMKNMTMTVSAIGWRKIDEDQIVKKQFTGEEYAAGLNRYWFCCFVDHNRLVEGEDPWKDDPTIPKRGERAGFGAWSFFTIAHGDKLLPRIELFEGDQKPRFRGGDLGWYTKNPDRKYDLLHEIRWIFTAFFMMAQRLSARTRHQTSRQTRRRIERNKQKPPPWIEIVTLRRKQQAREEAIKEGKGKLPVDWQWQWPVSPHWRYQWYESEGVHRHIFIESYLKGPKDKPIKPPTNKIFVAER